MFNEITNLFITKTEPLKNQTTYTKKLVINWKFTLFFLTPIKFI